MADESKGGAISLSSGTSGLNPPSGRHFRLRWLELALASLGINLLSLTLPLLTLQVYDSVMRSGQAATLDLLCLGAATAIIIESTLRICRAYSIGWAGVSFEHTVATNAVGKMLTGDTRAIESQGVAEYMQRINAINRMGSFYSGRALQTWIDLPFVLLFLFMIGVIGHQLVLVPVLLLLLMSAVAMRLGRKLKKNLGYRDAVDESRYNFLIRTLTGIHTVKALGVEERFEREHHYRQGQSARANYAVAIKAAMVFDQGILFTNVMMIGVAVAGAPLVLQGNLTLGALLACVLLAARIMQPVQRALEFWTRWQELSLAHKKLKALLDVPQLSKARESEPLEREGRVELQNVSFAYPGQPKILDDVTLTLKRGDAIAISSAMGSGKTTVSRLLLGLYEPTEGKILVDGVPPQSYSSNELVEHIAYLPQEGVILRGTIQDNLSRFGVVPQQRVAEMCRLLGIADDVNTLPEGYDTRIEGGNVDTIPPGLRQRIAIARVLALKPRVILFHNTDRALDTTGYNLLYSLLGQLKGRVTLILISDDENIMKLADTHYRLEGGKLVPQSRGDMESCQTPFPQEMRA